jgi:P27 family predicted phage terminase small subunit
MRGRRPEPAAIKTAKGNPGRRPIGDHAAEGHARAPDWLTGQGREIWTRLAPDLARMNLLKRPDELTFGRYCELFGLWLTARKGVEAGGLVTVTNSEHVENMERLSKHLAAMLLIEKRLVDMEDRFGLNPANRQRIYAQRAQAGANVPGDLPFGGDDTPPPSSSPERTPIGFLN